MGSWAMLRSRMRLSSPATGPAPGYVTATPSTAVQASPCGLVCPRRSAVMDLGQVGVDGVRRLELLAAPATPVEAGVLVDLGTPPATGVHHAGEVVVRLLVPTAPAVPGDAGVYERSRRRLGDCHADFRILRPRPQRQRQIQRVQSGSRRTCSSLPASDEPHFWQFGEIRTPVAGREVRPW
jgi:hypothetical protein